MFLQPIKDFPIIHKVFNTITKILIIISRVFSMIKNVAAPRSNLVGSRTLQDSTMCSKAQLISIWDSHCKRDLVALMNTYGSIASPMLESMIIQSTISPFVIDDNNSCSPCKHAPLFSSFLPLSSSLPLWHQWKRVTTYLYLKSLTLIIVHCSPC